MHPALPAGWEPTGRATPCDVSHVVSFVFSEVLWSFPFFLNILLWTCPTPHQEESSTSCQSPVPAPAFRSPHSSLPFHPPIPNPRPGTPVLAPPFQPPIPAPRFQNPVPAPPFRPPHSGPPFQSPILAPPFRSPIPAPPFQPPIPSPAFCCCPLVCKRFRLSLQDHEFPALSAFSFPLSPVPLLPAAFGNNLNVLPPETG